MEHIDLNLDNYDLNDLLKLFKLKINFNENDLKEAKKIVHLIHPDKSGLDSKYFIFYKKAYDLIYHIYKINHKTTTDKVSNVSYDTLKQDYYQSDRSKAVQSIQKSSQFNQHFNQLFDEHYIKDEHGYGDWLKKEEESLSYDKLKKQSRDLALRTNIEEMVAKGSYTNLDAPNTYTTNDYMDLREAYTTGSVIGVDEHLDFHRVKKYNSVEELKNERSKIIKPISSNHSEQILKQQQEEENQKSIQRMYNLTVEHEQQQKKQASFWTKFLNIKS
jgi:hypothetical protein